MVRVEMRNMETGEVISFIGDDALVVSRNGDEVDMATTGGDADSARELAGLCRDFFDAQENACGNEQPKRGPRGALVALH